MVLETGIAIYAMYRLSLSEFYRLITNFLPVIGQLQAKEDFGNLKILNRAYESGSRKLQ